MKPDPFELTLAQSIAQAQAVGDEARAEHGRQVLRRHRDARIEQARRASQILSHHDHSAEKDA